MPVFAGVDEAGRGAVIGPMVIAGVSVDHAKEAQLLELGLKDSKLLSPAQREAFYPKIEAIAEDIVIVKVSACRIDSMMRQGINLNRIEVLKFLDVLTMLNPHVAYIDSMDVKPERLRKTLQPAVPQGKLVVEHKADVKYPVVSAASIIAKVTRDREVQKLHQQFGDFGPGYSSNEKTMAWLRDWLTKNKEYPDIVRRGWMTTKAVEGQRWQQRIAGFWKRPEAGCAPAP